MEELQYNDPGCSPESHESANQIDVGKPHAVKMELCPVKISWRTEETRASQPGIQSNPVNDHSEEFIPIGEKKWNDILANAKFKRHTLESSISKLVLKVVRHLDPQEREIGGAVHC